MNQPKFKFGDKVNNPRKAWGPFVVDQIFYDENGIYNYSGKGYDDVTIEDDLVLLQEPQKKKLYAYKHDSEVHFFTDSGRIMSADRAPEYDIEYKEKKCTQE